MAVYDNTIGSIHLRGHSLVVAYHTERDGWYFVAKLDGARLEYAATAEDAWLACVLAAGWEPWEVGLESEELARALGRHALGGLMSAEVML